MIELLFSDPSAVGAFTDFSATGLYLDPLLRITRVFLLLIGLVSLCTALIGAFSFMNASDRDDAHHHAEAQIRSGLTGSFMVCIFFAITTFALMRVG